MYSIRSGYILGFHGCNKDVAERIVTRQSCDLKFSTNDWDWLGHGMYFWENNTNRALKWATDEATRATSKIKEPAVLGAVIVLGKCLDLLDSSNLELVKTSHDYFRKLCFASDMRPPINRSPKGAHQNDRLIRNLDCAVIETLHNFVPNRFDSVRGMFGEGKPLYRGAGFREKDHIQICIRNPNCIKGYFLPKELNATYSRV